MAVRFAAAIRHRGAHAHCGHYLTTCWLGGDKYAEINCSPCRQLISDWRAAIDGIGKEVYVLFYVRLGFRDGAGDGSFEKDQGPKKQKPLQERQLQEPKLNKSDPKAHMASLKAAKKKIN